MDLFESGQLILPNSVFLRFWNSSTHKSVGAFVIMNHSFQAVSSSFNGLQYSLDFSLFLFLSFKKAT